MGTPGCDVGDVRPLRLDHMQREPVIRVPYRPGFGALAGNTTTIASGAASGAAAGAAAGPIGAVIGGAIGAIAGIFGGQSNPQIQIDKNNAIQLFSQYQGIAGTVSGRSIGLENMNLIFRGACFEGHFPSWNNETELPDSLMSMPGSPYGQNDNCFAVLWSAAAKGVPAPGSSGVHTGNNGVPVKDAKTFVANYVWPSNSPDVDTDPWATNTDSVGMQVIIDCADAYIATQTSSSVPYIANAPTPAPTAATTPVSTSPIAPTPVATSPVPTTASTPATPATSANGATLTVQQSGTLVTPQGTWGQTGGAAFTLNGAQVTNLTTQSDWTVALYYNTGMVFAYNKSGHNFVWNNQWLQVSAPPAPSSIQQVLSQYVTPPAASTTPTTVASSTPQAPPIPTVVDSTDGSTVTATGTALETQGGTLIYLGPQASGDPGNSQGYPVWENGTHQGYAVGLLMGNGGTVYAVNASGLWDQWSENGWVQLPGAPNLNSATPTTSTVASPQSTSTTGNATSTTGTVVATTASGDTVSDSDIQDLINQISAQGATQTQALQSVLQALQESGANLTPAVQTQVASQVASSIPTAVTSTSSSDTGLYVVGGGLALLALMFFMNRRNNA